MGLGRYLIISAIVGICDTESKAFLTSKKTTQISLTESREQSQSLKTEISADVGMWCHWYLEMGALPAM